jgi:glycine/D-amino acid oxidase-like deaminating enzyme
MTASDTKTYGESWYAATMADAPSRPRLTVDLDVDVCVIGGGLAGLTTAREVARAGWSVVLLEAGRLAANASGRNNGFVLPGFDADADKLIARVGFEQTKSLWALAEAGLDYVRAVIKTAGAGIEPRDGWLHVSKVDDGENVARYAQLLGELGSEVEAWPTERVRAVLHSERYFHALHYVRALTIHPVNYALALADAAEADGARIFENTPALAIDPAGVRKRIITPGARLRANHVVLCGNLQIGSLMPRLATTLLPVVTYVITTAPLGPRLGEVVGYRGAVSDTDLADNHYRIVGGDRLMLSGRSTVWLRHPRRYVRALTGDIKKTYPQLGDVTADYAWSGTLGLTIHRMPQIGELGPGIWLASGFGGHGLNTTAMAGNLIARAIVGGDQTWRKFTPFELVWAGGMLGRAAAQMRFWFRRQRDAIAERRARAREMAQRRAQEAEVLLAAQQPAPFTLAFEAELPAAEPEHVAPIEAEIQEAGPQPLTSVEVELPRVDPERFAPLESELSAARPSTSVEAELPRVDPEQFAPVEAEPPAGTADERDMAGPEVAPQDGPSESASTSSSDSIVPTSEQDESSPPKPSVAQSPKRPRRRRRGASAKA